jgi:hypothetical protein
VPCGDSSTVPTNFIFAKFGSRYRLARSLEISPAANLTSAAESMLLVTILALVEIARSVPAATMIRNAPIVEATSSSTSVNPVFLTAIFIELLLRCASFNIGTFPIKHGLGGNAIWPIAVYPGNSQSH